MLIGYARISTTEQSLTFQHDELTKAGCEKIFSDTASGIIDERPGINQALEFARAGDIIVVWKLDRLGRSLRHLIEMMNKLNSRKVGLKCLQESLDTTTPGGKLVFHVFGAIAEFERELIVERTQAGIVSARQRGIKGGRPPKMDDKTISMAKSLMADPKNSVTEVCQSLKISRATLYRALSKAEKLAAQETA